MFSAGYLTWYQLFAWTGPAFTFLFTFCLVAASVLSHDVPSHAPALRCVLAGMISDAVQG